MHFYRPDQQRLEHYFRPSPKFLMATTFDGTYAGQNAIDVVTIRNFELTAG